MDKGDFLMVGDIVSVDYGNGYEYHRISDYIDLSEISEMDWKPIPLTVDIVKGIGYVAEEPEGFCYSIEGEGLWLLPYQDGSWLCKVYNISNIRTKIRYVHDLQHVFMVCDIEKEIKL